MARGQAGPRPTARKGRAYARLAVAMGKLGGRSPPAARRHRPGHGGTLDGRGAAAEISAFGDQ